MNQFTWDELSTIARNLHYLVIFAGDMARQLESQPEHNPDTVEFLRYRIAESQRMIERIHGVMDETEGETKP